MDITNARYSLDGNDENKIKRIQGQVRITKQFMEFYTQPIYVERLVGNLFYDNNINIKDIDILRIQLLVGSIFCNKLDLVSIKGSPKQIVGSFRCQENQLTSLQGGPKDIGRHYNCSHNKLTTLQHAPKIIGETFDCSYNELKNLQGSPRHVKENFICSHNKLTSLQGSLQIVGGDFDCSNNPTKFTQQQVRKYIDVGGKIIV